MLNINYKKIDMRKITLSSTYCFILHIFGVFLCNAQEVKEDEIFNLYKPDFVNEEEVIILDFTPDLVQITPEFSEAKGVESLTSPTIDINVEQERPTPEVVTFEDLTSDGLLALKKGHYEAADVLYRKALELEPENTDVLFAIGYANQMMDKNNVAKEFYKKILKVDKYYVKAFQNFFAILVKENPSYAIQKLKEMVQANPYHPVILSQLGAVYFHINDLQLALRYYLRAIQMDPDNAGYFYNIAVIYEQLKDYETAIQYYEKTLHYIDENSAFNRLEILEKIRSLGAY